MIGFARRRKIMIDRLQYKLLAINLGYLLTIVFLFIVVILHSVPSRSLLFLYRDRFCIPFCGNDSYKYRTDG